MPMHLKCFFFVKNEFDEKFDAKPLTHCAFEGKFVEKKESDDS